MSENPTGMSLWRIDRILEHIGEAEGVVVQDAVPYLVGLLHSRDRSRRMPMVELKPGGETRVLDEHEQNKVISLLMRLNGTKELLDQLDSLSRYSLKESDVAPLLHLEGYLLERPSDGGRADFDELFRLMLIHRDAARSARRETTSASEELASLRHRLSVLEDAHSKLQDEAASLRNDTAKLRKAAEASERHQSIAENLRQHLKQRHTQEERHSKKLYLLIQASHEFWSSFDPGEGDTRPLNEDVERWLQDQGGDLFQKGLAKSGASIIRPEWVQKGRRPRK